jgi:putative transposase
MANTYTQISIQLVFAVKGRQSLIPQQHAEELYKFITGIIQHPTRKHKLLAINGMPDHLHIFVGLHPAMDISSLVRDIKSNSSAFINERRFVQGEFHWQTGYGAFSYSHSHRSEVIRYIQNQQEHHRRRTFRDEYEELLRRFEVEFDSHYMFEWIEDE